MVNRREATLAAACRDALVYIAACAKEQQVNSPKDDAPILARQLREALKIKSKPARRRVVIGVSGGVAEVEWRDRGTKVTIKDYDNCGICGGVDCEGGHRAVEVHGRQTGRL